MQEEWPYYGIEPSVNLLGFGQWHQIDLGMKGGPKMVGIHVISGQRNLLLIRRRFSVTD